MKRALLFCIALNCLLNIVSAQTAKINISVTNPKFSGHVHISDPTANFADLKNPYLTVDLDKNGNGSVTIDVPHVKYVNVGIYSTSAFDGADRQLFLSPGDNLNLKITFDGRLRSKIVVTGQGSNNNQDAFKAFTDIWADNKHAQDKSPYAALSIFKKELGVNNKLFQTYLIRSGFTDNGLSQNQPTADFVKITRYNLDYYLTIKYFDLKTATLDETHFSGPWQKVQDSLFKTIKLSNDDALQAFNYQNLLSMFMLRERERLWRMQEKQPAMFYKDWFNTTDLKKGEKIFNDERKNLLSERIINRYFSGKTAEFLYVELLKNNLRESNYKNISVIFNHFKQKYPEDPAVKMFRGPIGTIVEKQSKKLTEKMIVAANNGTYLNTLKEVKILFKGKTVFVDMWGTWCGPCREDIEKNTEDLHNFFRKGDITFLYIANFDLKNEDEWRKSIAYYGLEGNHILANEKLSKDLMAQLKTNGFPTYFIIKKDGTFFKTKSQYPMQEQQIVKELLAAEK